MVSDPPSCSENVPGADVPSVAFPAAFGVLVGFAGCGYRNGGPGACCGQDGRGAVGVVASGGCHHRVVAGFFAGVHGDDEQADALSVQCDDADGVLVLRVESLEPDGVAVELDPAGCGVPGGEGVDHLPYR